MKKLGSSLALALATAACGTHIDYVPLNAPPHPIGPRAPQSVTIFTSSLPDRPFVEIGTMESQQQQWSTDDTADIYAKMREEAGRQGCDALIILGANDATLVSGSDGSVSSKTLKGYRASCVVYTDTEVRGGESR